MKPTKPILKALAIVLLLLMLYSCNNDRTIYVISSDPELQLPFKASKFFGFFEKKGIKLQCDTTPDSSSLIRFLNFSKYTIVITDAKTVTKIENYTKRWIPICVVAFKRKENNLNISKRGRFILLMKDSILKKRKEAIAIIKGWNYGVELLRDPAVAMLLSPKKEIQLKFIQCGKQKYE